MSGRLRALLRSFRDYIRGVLRLAAGMLRLKRAGKLDADWETFLARAVGLAEPLPNTRVRGGAAPHAPEALLGQSFAIRVKEELDAMKEYTRPFANEKINREGLTVENVIEELRRRAQTYDRKQVLAYVRELQAMPDAELFLDASGNVVTLHGLAGKFDWLAEPDEPFGLKEKGPLKSQKVNIPKTNQPMPVFPINGTPDLVEKNVLAWMGLNANVVARDGRTIRINNPEKDKPTAPATLSVRARHLMGSYGKNDPYKKSRRIMKADKVRSIAAIPTTLKGAQVIAEIRGGGIVYLRRYAGGELHAVFTDGEGTIVQQGPVKYGLKTQYELDKAGIKDATIHEDWTRAPDPFVKP